MGCGASTHVRERLDWISQLEAEIQDLKAQRSEALQRITVSESEKENIAIQSLRNRTQAGQARKVAIVTEQHAIVDKAYLEANYARAKANEEEVLRELKELKTEHQLLKLEFSSARLQHTAHVKHLERDVQNLNKEKVSSVKTLTSNYEIILNEQLMALREFKEEVIEFLEHIVTLADGLKVKQIKMDSTVDIERRKEELAAFNAIPLADYVKEAKEFLKLDPLLAPIAEGKSEQQKSLEEIEAEKIAEVERLQEEEERRAAEAERVQRDREERARVRALAEEAPKLQKQVIKLEEEVKQLKSTADDLRVQLARQAAAMLKQGSPTGKAHEEDVGTRERFEEKHDKSRQVRTVEGLNFSSPTKGEDREDLDAADVEIRLDRAFEEITDPVSRDKFTQLFIADVAKALGIPPDMIQINGFESGSIIVKFTIMPPSCVTQSGVELETPMELAHRLQLMAHADKSPLLDGIVTSSTIGISSRPSSRASSPAQSAVRGGLPQDDHHHEEQQSMYHAARHVLEVKEETSACPHAKLESACEVRKRRDGPTEEEHAAARLRDLQARAAPTWWEAHERCEFGDGMAGASDLREGAVAKFQAEVDGLEADETAADETVMTEYAPAEKYGLEEDEEMERQVELETEQLEGEMISSGFEDQSVVYEQQRYSGKAHQTSASDERMTVASSGAANADRLVPGYVHASDATCGKFFEEREKLSWSVFSAPSAVCLLCLVWGVRSFMMQK